MELAEVDIRDLAEAMVPVAQEAGRAILALYSPDLAVRFKDDRSPVTEADQAAEDIILRALGKLMPRIPVIAEEQSAAGIEPDTARSFFLVDPLDGTRGFVKGDKDFTVNIALAVDGTPRFGLVYAPAYSDCYVTVGQGKAVQCELTAGGAAASLARLETKILSGDKVPERPFTAVVSRSHLTPETRAFLTRLAPAREIAMSSSLKFCVLARGEADVYPRFGQTSEWDTAAGHAVLLAAGGAVCTPEGRPLTYGKKESRFINPPFIAWRRAADVTAV